jgi:hypothetical protein
MAWGWIKPIQFVQETLSMKLPAQAIRRILKQRELRKRVPNQATVEGMTEAKQVAALKRYASFRELRERCLRAVTPNASRS